MNETKRTPGPWKQGVVNKRLVHDANAHVVARVSRASDAPIVAAAPDLLTLLERIDNLLAEWKNLNYINYGKMKTCFDEDLEQTELEISEFLEMIRTR